MKIKRTWKEKSLRAGETQIDNEATVREVFGQTSVAHHPDGACGKISCHYCPEPAMQRLLAGAVVETFFCDFKLTEA